MEQPLGCGRGNRLVGGERGHRPEHGQGDEIPDQLGRCAHKTDGMLSLSYTAGRPEASGGLEWMIFPQ